MKIKSKFKDYYDGVNPLYAEEPLFLRHTQSFKVSYYQQIQVADCPEGPLKDLLYQVACLPVSCLLDYQIVVVFCGKVYSGCVASGHEADSSGWPVFQERYFWKPSVELTTTLLSLRKKGRDKAFTVSDAESQISAWYADQGLKDQKLLDAQLKAVTPIVVRRYLPGGTEITVNPILKTFDFAKIVPPEQAWQELSMFFGTVVMPEKNTIQISDKDRHQQHGFDKHSFRRTSKELRGK
jgi:hypothetical protein